jgi:DNA-binding response OmpR family regulator
MNGRVPIVLLIEHDALQRGTLARILKAAGYCVIPVGRAHEALETFSMHHVDIALVVADTQTQSLSGPPLLGALCAIDHHVPVVALSSGVATDRPAYEYPNVAATLIRPFEPEDVVALAERVLRVAAFNWPPTEEDLADIQVVDTATWQDARSFVTPAIPPKEPKQPEQPEARALVKPPIEAQALVKPSSAPLVAIARDELAAPPRLVIRGLERQPWRYDFRMSARSRRMTSVAATAICGLALTTLLELRSIPTNDPFMAETTPEVASAPLVLAAREHRLDAMPLVSAGRVRPRATADIISRRPAPNLAGAADGAANAPIRLTRTLVTETRSEKRLNAPEPTRGNAASAAMTAKNNARDVPLGAVTNDTRKDATRDAVTRDTRTVAALTTPPASIAPAAPTAASSLEGAEIRDTPTRDVARPDVAPRAEAAARIREEERGIYQVLQQYQRAYEQLDVNAARAVWPTLNTRALTRAFEGLKAQALEFSHCRVAMEPSEATAICGGSASYVPRVGRQDTRTEPREWTFHLRKTDRDWLIAKAEVRLK